MKSVVIERPNEISLVERDIPQPGPGELMVQVMASGICGTDLHIFRGEYMGSYPVIPGHEFSGVVAAVGSGIRASMQEIVLRWSRTLPAITVSTA